MLLTFPTKDSLLRYIRENNSEQQYLIVANYRALANWNLIPLNSLTVLLGPNSAGKSSVYDALDGLQMLVNGIRADDNDKRIDLHYAAKRSDDTEPCIGFSCLYPDIRSEISSLAGVLDNKQNRDIEEEIRSRVFPVLSEIVTNDSLDTHLRDTVYTFLIETISDDDLSLSVYLDGELAGNINSENVDLEISICGKAARLLFNQSELLKQATISNKNNFSKSFRVNRWTELSMGPDYIYSHEPWAINDTFESDELFGYTVALFHAPITKILSGFRRGITKDVRSLSSEWGFCDRRGSSSGHVIGHLKAQNSFKINKNPDYPNSLISDEISVFLGWLEKEKSSLYMVNRWLKEPGFLATPYQIEVAIKACIHLADLKGQYSIKNSIKKDSLIAEDGVEYLGAAFIRDDIGRVLKFSEVGAGFSQVIPMLVALANDWTVLYKQPEVHLHPKLQSKVADCFIEAVNNFKYGFRIIETHSEHFVLRLLRRVRESHYDELLHSSLTLQEKDFSLIYFQRKEDYSEIHQIRVTSTGEFVDSWPDGFFDERDEEIWGSTW